MQVAIKFKILWSGVIIVVVYSDIIVSQERLNLLPIDGEISIHSVQYDPNTVHINDQGPFTQQIDPVIVDSETVTVIILREPIININDSVADTAKTIISVFWQNPEFTINKKGQLNIPWPNCGKEPISEFTTMHFFTLVFPVLFPYGIGYFRVNKPRTCTSLANGQTIYFGIEMVALQTINFSNLLLTI